jgi:hypothetical protein
MKVIFKVFHLIPGTALNYSRQEYSILILKTLNNDSKIKFRENQEQQRSLPDSHTLNSHHGTELLQLYF